jgi:outer membrane protein assembly complex protein YaeT
VIADVRFTGLHAVSVATLKPLNQNPGDWLDPYRLKQDRDKIRDSLLLKGYHFSSVKEEILEEPGGAVLHWRVTEGPLVMVRAIEITGNDHFPAGDLKILMQTKEAGSFLLIPTPGSPYVQYTLEEDLKRLKLAYYQEGWLDIMKDDRIFIEDLLFTPDRTEVSIRLHVDEGQRYRIRNISFAGNTVINAEGLTAVLTSKVGEDYVVSRASLDAARIQDMYGERAYILAQVEHVTTILYDRQELDLVFRITENQEIMVGRIVVNGNTKTRFDVILRELKDFAPGEKFNKRLLIRGLQRLRDRQYFDPQAGLSARLEESQEPGVRDVILEVKEGSTGTIRFAGGYSSAFGILGIIEFEQRNFDIADLPKSLGDLFSGEAFAGGGQLFSIRYAPSRTSQSFGVLFREPYFFGYDFGMGVSGRSINTQRESWKEERLSASLILERRFDPFRVELGVSAMRLELNDLEFDAPATVRGLEGVNRIFSMTPAIVLDTRDSLFIPTSGHKILLSYEFAGHPLPGDFDFGKTYFDVESFFTLFEPTPDRKHVVNFDLTLGYARPRGDSTVPFFERYYAGGRGSIRGFDFRGVGPREAGDPIGGNAYAFFSTEYQYPIVGNVLYFAVFYDLANLTPAWDDLYHVKWRNTVGFGIKFIIPQLGNIPVSIDFGFPLSKRDDDDRETVTFDIGKLFF